MRLLLFSISCVALLYSQQGFALIVDTIYEATVPVTSQSADQRKMAIQKAFSQVIIKASGNVKSLADPKIKTQLARASNYVQSYLYLSLHGQDSLQLRVFFDENSVNHLLRQSSQHVWGENRPLILVWLAEAGDTGRNLFASDTDFPAQQVLAELAAKRGLPIMFPLLDLEDQAKVHIADVWAPFVEGIRQASTRYGSDAILVGRLYSGTHGDWYGHWTLLLGEEQYPINITSDAIASVLTKSMDQVTEILASHFSVQGKQHSRHINLTVSGITSLSKYAEARAYLQQLTPVMGVQVVRAGANQIEFSLKSLGSKEALGQIIQLDNRMRSDPTSSENSHLQYHWIQ